VPGVCALTGDVQRWDGARWVTVLAAAGIPVTDRRRVSRLFERTDTFADGDPRGRSAPGPPAHDHVRRWP
jgi:hypothetical protein